MGIGFDEKSLHTLRRGMLYPLSYEGIKAVAIFSHFKPNRMADKIFNPHKKC